jgi:uroporphyrinogen III methyltransferase/synthase
MPSGKVYLVGAGPGDPGLITVRGLNLLRQAEVLIYDRLVHPDLVAEAPTDAVRVYVGKESGRHCMSQAQINRLLVASAQQGAVVVRLKGGDPFVFGRGGEEAQALVEAAIPFEIVPGVSSAVAVPAYAGIPLTHRKLASSFAVITGHEEAEKEESSLPWAELAAAVDTLVILMGVKSLPQIVQHLISAGRSPETPVALIRQGTTAEQFTVIGTLADIVAKAEAVKLAPPVVIVIGKVVKLREQLQWFTENVSCEHRRPVEEKAKSKSQKAKSKNRKPWTFVNSELETRNFLTLDLGL